MRSIKTHFMNFLITMRNLRLDQGAVLYLYRKNAPTNTFGRIKNFARVAFFTIIFPHINKKSRQNKAAGVLEQSQQTTPHVFRLPVLYTHAAPRHFHLREV